MSDPRTPQRRIMPTVDQPLRGLTILLVEDSRFASEAIRLMCRASGARLRRADTLLAARKHLAVYCPSVTIIDMDLPDGSGADLIADLTAPFGSHTPVLGISGDEAACAAALAAGAHAILRKPIAGLGIFQEKILGLLPPEARPAGLRTLSPATPSPDPLALHDDLERAADLVAPGADAPTLAYAGRFLAGVARCAGDSRLGDLAERLRAGLSDSAIGDVRAELMDRIKTRQLV